MTINEIYSELKNKYICCWGYGRHFHSTVKPFFERIGLIDNLCYIVDANHIGEDVVVGSKSITIISLDDLKEKANTNIVIVISVFDFEPIIQIIENDCFLSKISYYIGSALASLSMDYDLLTKSKPDINFRKNAERKIDPIINTFWFSGDPLPDLYNSCLESWKKYCPSYEIRIWSLNDYSTSCEYFNEAVSVKKWAFASDYARADVIYKYGGIYMDLDVEVVRNLDDLLYNDAYMGFEDSYPLYIECGSGFGSVKGNRIIGDIRTSYMESHFIKEDGSYDLSHCPGRYTDVLLKYGLKQDGNFQYVEDITIYPFEMLTAKSNGSGKIYSTNYTYTIHHHNGSWTNIKEKKILQKRYEIIAQNRFYKK